MREIYQKVMYVCGLPLIKVSIIFKIIYLLFYSPNPFDYGFAFLFSQKVTVHYLRKEKRHG